jgi:hypothetical protein
MLPNINKALSQSVAPLIASILLLGAATVVSAETKKAPRAESKQYKLITRPPVRSIPVIDIEQTHILSNQAIIVESGPERGYLLTLQRPCEQLQADGVISFTNTLGAVEAGFDSVVEGETRQFCLIDKIYPLATPAEIKKAQAEQAQKGQPSKK